MESESSNTQSYVATTWDEGEVMYSETITIGNVEKDLLKYGY